MFAAYGCALRAITMQIEKRMRRLSSWIGVTFRRLEHDPEKHALGLDPMGGNRFSLATNAERVCAEIMLKQRARA